MNIVHALYSSDFTIDPLMDSTNGSVMRGSDQNSRLWLTVYSDCELFVVDSLEIAHFCFMWQLHLPCFHQILDYFFQGSFGPHLHNFNTRWSAPTEFAQNCLLLLQINGLLSRLHELSDSAFMQRQAHPCHHPHDKARCQTAFVMNSTTYCTVMTT